MVVDPVGGQAHRRGDLGGRGAARGQGEDPRFHGTDLGVLLRARRRGGCGGLVHHAQEQQEVRWRVRLVGDHVDVQLAMAFGAAPAGPGDLDRVPRPAPQPYRFVDRVESGAGRQPEERQRVVPAQVAGQDAPFQGHRRVHHPDRAVRFAEGGRQWEEVEEDQEPVAPEDRPLAIGRHRGVGRQPACLLPLVIHHAFPPVASLAPLPHCAVPHCAATPRLRDPQVRGARGHYKIM